MAGNNTIFTMSDSLKDIYSFEKVISVEDQILNEGFTCLDFSGVSFIEPYSMTNLLLLGRRYLKNRGDKLKIIKLPLPLHQYLVRMDFFKTGVFEIESTLSSDKKLKRSAFSNRVIELTEIPHAERDSVLVISKVVTLFRKRASHILRHWFNQEVVNFFVTIISEICQNVFEHSMDTGYLALQTYSYNKENVIRLVIADSGIGIEESFKEDQKEKYGRGSELIKNALTTPISGKRPFGYGLCRVNAIIREMKGNLYVRSNESSVAFVYNKGYNDKAYCFQKNDLTFFGGTQISISLYG